LAIEVGEGDAFLRDAIDVRRAIPHHATTEVADVPDADVITPDDQNVRLLRCHVLSPFVRGLAG
jgi:hypothetical protein